MISPLPVTIRPMEPRDVSTAARFSKPAIHGDVDQETIAEWFSRCIMEPEVFAHVATIGSQEVVGIGLSSPGHYVCESERAVILRLLAVDEPYQGRKIGEQLLVSLLTLCMTGFTCVALYVDSRNERAKSLYQKFGFQRAEVSEDIPSIADYLLLEGIQTVEYRRLFHELKRALEDRLTRAEFSFVG